MPDKNDVPHERYEKTKKSWYQNQHDTAKAWAKGKYPAEEGTAIIKNSGNFKGIQKPDGSGVLKHYRTIEAMRTLNGLILNNSQCWSRGFAKCSPPPNIDHTLPLTALESELRGTEYKLKNINKVKTSGRHHIVLIDGGELAYYTGTDPSIINGENTIMMEIKEDEYKLDPEEIPEKLLQPEEVKKSDMRIVDASEYTKTRFTDPDEETIERENLKEDHSRWGADNRYKNHKAYLEKYQGEVIVRHGEYFFIPEPEFEPGKMEEPTEPGDKTELGSHRPKRKDGVWKVDGEIYVRGSISHSDNDHNMVNLGETWHKAVTHNRNVEVIEGTGRRAD